MNKIHKEKLKELESLLADAERLGENLAANKIRKQIVAVIAERELEEANRFFEDFAKDCPTANAGCSHSQTNFSKSSWR